MKSRILSETRPSQKKACNALYVWKGAYSQADEPKLIVFFVAEKEGVVISGRLDRCGNFEKSLISYMDDAWELFKGELVISN